MRDQAPIERLNVSAYAIPTDHEDAITLVLVELDAAGQHALGYSYTNVAIATFIERSLKSVVIGRDALSVAGVWNALVERAHALGTTRAASPAIAAIDIALWDLKARLLDKPLFALLGAVRDRIPIYGSGGFSSYSIARLQAQLADWAARGISRVEMEVGREPARDLERARAAREAIGARTELFVDASGAYPAAQARAMADALAELGVTWFEEPVAPDDLDSMRWVRAHAPPGMEIASGERGCDQHDFKRLLVSEAMDVLQIDATRCAGVTGFLQAAALCEAFGAPLSAPGAPAIHAHTCCAVARARHVAHFHDHVRSERLLFDGVLEPRDGALVPSRARAGLGLELKRADARRYKIG